MASNIAKIETICSTLDEHRHYDNNLFSKTDYWKLSELALIYPNYFDINSPVSNPVINQIHAEAYNTIPEFKNITPRPEHIVTIKTKIRPGIPINQKLTNINDQKLSRVACEYLFRQIPGTEIQQAYFMYPYNHPIELYDIIKELYFKRVRTNTIKLGNRLSSITNHAVDSQKSSFSIIWTILWCTFFNQQSLTNLRNEYQIKQSQSICDHMSLQMLVFINQLLQEIIIKLQEYQFIHISEIANIIKTKAYLARTIYINRTGNLPESDIIYDNTYPRIKKLRRNHQAFLQKFYPISLQK